uniref:Uncharacterized protein n=1 Tax=Aegilops tauschii subsp. strangulata TaxID=200361 RepID=A0A453IT28_AEGTS
PGNAREACSASRRVFSNSGDSVGISPASGHSPSPSPSVPILRLFVFPSPSCHDPVGKLGCHH